MSEHELSTLLRDHLSDEPPVGVSSADAIRTGHRQGRLRLAVGGGAVVLLLGAGAVVIPGLGDDDGGTPGRAEDDAPAATQQATSVPDLLESAAAERLAPLVGELGTPTWDVTNVDGAQVGPEADDAQFFQVTYKPTGTPEVHLRVGGFAEEDAAFFLAPACPTSEEEKVVSSCTDETLPDGTIVTTAIGPHTRVTNTGSRLVTVQVGAAAPRQGPLGAVGDRRLSRRRPGRGLGVRRGDGPGDRGLAGPRGRAPRHRHRPRTARPRRGRPPADGLSAHQPARSALDSALRTDAQDRRLRTAP